MMIFECQVLACGFVLLLHGCMVTWSVFYWMNSLFNARIDYICFVSFFSLQGFPPIATNPLGNTTNSVAIGGTIAPKR
jgi:hypothetical protein